MTIPASARRPLSPTPESGTVYFSQTPDGSGSVTHPSVVDMGYRWNGYRWWMADTPYPTVGGDTEENPCIWGSNDRINWHVPAGLTNPIYPWSGRLGEFNNDTDLSWDPTRRRLVCYWRENRPGHIRWRASSSADGVTWDYHGTRHQHDGVSAAIELTDSGQWRKLTFSGPASAFVADDILGPWSPAPTSVTGIEIAPGGAVPHHANVLHLDGLWICIGYVVGHGGFGWVSADGYQWHLAEGSFPAGYRCSMQPSTEPGQIDIWTARSKVYSRLPMTRWTDYLP